MTHLVLDDMQRGYVDLLKHVLEHGHDASPRGEKTIEVLGASFTLLDPYRAWPNGIGRRPVAALAVAETLQLIGGFHDPKALVKASPAFRSFLGPDGRQRSAYGPRVSSRMPSVVDQFRNDPDSRRAIIAIWNDGDHQLGHTDYPCTCLLQWIIRDEKLHAFTYMRSNDLWLGTPYDVFMFTRLQITLAERLAVGVGPYNHSATSLHLYKQHEDAAQLVRMGWHNRTEIIDPFWLDSVRGNSGWDDAINRAHRLHRGQSVESETAFETWAREHVL